MDHKNQTREELLAEVTRLRERVVLLEQEVTFRLQDKEKRTDPAPDVSHARPRPTAETTDLRTLEDTTRLLQALNAAQDRYIANGDPQELFDGLLSALLVVTQSQYGFIDEVHCDRDGSKYRQVRSISSRNRNADTGDAYGKLKAEGSSFFNLNNLTGAVIVSGRAVIANDPTNDPRRGGLPPGHPDIRSFMGLPLMSGGALVGIVGAANRPGGYSQKLADFLKPYLDTCATIIMAYRNEQRRREAEQALRREQEELERRVQERTADLLGTNLLLQQEIAERQRVAQALSESETRYRTVFENAGDAILLLEAGDEDNGRIISANQTAADIHGYTIEELIGMSIQDLDPEATPEVRRQRCERLDRGEVLKEEVQHVKKDGTTFPVEMCVALIKLGRKKYVLATDRDITERKLFEQALRDSEQKYREFAEFLPQIVYELDSRGDVTFINEAGWEIGGYSRDEVGEKLNILELAAPHDRERISRDRARLMRGESVIGEEYSVLKKNGETFPVVAYMSPLTRHGKIDGIRGVAVDISDLKRAVEQSQKHRAEAEKASRTKSEFLAGMSHELRTPLNAVIGFSEVLEDRFFGPLNETQLKYVGYILTSGRHLLRLIDDLLDLARIESGKISLQLSEVSLVEILKSSLVMMKQTLKQHKLRPELLVAPDLASRPIRADEVRLRQVVSNLLSNATKFTPEQGRIRICARKSGDEAIVSVSDTGIGIDPIDHQRIFNVFEQVDETLAGVKSGTGLGLALTRNLVEMHGGRIWVESPGPGKGSSFSFAIPVRGPDIQESEEADARSFSDPASDGSAHYDYAPENLEDSWIRFHVLREADKASCS